LARVEVDEPCGFDAVLTWMARFVEKADKLLLAVSGTSGVVMRKPTRSAKLISLYLKQFFALVMYFFMWVP
jgi:hypothetical protein